MCRHLCHLSGNRPNIWSTFFDQANYLLITFVHLLSDLKQSFYKFGCLAIKYWLTHMLTWIAKVVREPKIWQHPPDYAHPYECGLSGVLVDLFTNGLASFRWISLFRPPSSDFLFAPLEFTPRHLPHWLQEGFAKAILTIAMDLARLIVTPVAFVANSTSCIVNQNSLPRSICIRTKCSR